MKKSNLTDQQVADFGRHGFLVVRGMFDADEMSRITEWTDELQAWPETPGKHMMYFEESMTEKGRRVLNRLENFVPYHDGMAQTINGPSLLDSVSDLFGEDAILFKEKINFKLPGGGGFEPHQDAQAGWDSYADLFVTAMLTVDPTTIENGCLEVGHWDHRRQLIGGHVGTAELSAAGRRFVRAGSDRTGRRDVLRFPTRRTAPRPNLTGTPPAGALRDV